MKIGKIFISKIYRLFRNCFVFGISFDIFDHVLFGEGKTQKCLTVEFLFWGIDIMMPEKVTQ